LVNTSDFPAGQYNYTCQTQDGQLGGTQSGFIPADGTLQALCYYGYPGRSAWVVIAGTAYEKRGW
jgi:hypothetical protein